MSEDNTDDLNRLERQAWTGWVSATFEVVSEDNTDDLNRLERQAWTEWKNEYHQNRPPEVELS
ncbi:hypothetical protein TSUD_114710 [Trifolium subterraneum]|uniref:Uncharacterized protein n=1 Tax=Trifolium subterraneum TaxID=3900 RepID=A0A2Z6N6V7_TRISU|nr:hypothetical protein TSUD_114710 [Trifolium subterraneum]